MSDRCRYVSTRRHDETDLPSCSLRSDEYIRKINGNCGRLIALFQLFPQSYILCLTKSPLIIIGYMIGGTESRMHGELLWRRIMTPK